MQKLITVAACVVPLHAAEPPIAKVITMISDLQAKIIKEGEAGQKEFAAFSEWCEERSRNLGFEIKTGTSEAKGLKATIAEEAARTASLTTKLDELASALSIDEADLKAATEIRDMDFKRFSATESELTDTVETLRRAIGLIEREMRGGASMMQLKGAASLSQAFTALVSASLIDTADASKLAAFVQSSQGDDEPGAPAGSVYESQSGNILETLQNLADEAETQLDDARKKETASKNQYEMLKQSLMDEIKFGKKEMSEAKKNIAGSSETKATAEGDLKVTSKELSSDIDAKSSLHQDCMSRAEEFETTTKSRAEELKALAIAKKVIKEATGAASSFVQVASMAGVGNTDAVRVVRDLAHKMNSPALAQLASRMASVVGAGGPFKKIKALIGDMIATLEAEAEADATEKAWCDRNLADANEKRAQKTAEIEKLTTRIDKATALSDTLKEEVATLQNELAKLAKSQVEMDKLRGEEKAAYDESKATNEKGLNGIKTALKVLREYYAKDASHDAADGASSSIISLLEVVESDITKTLASLTSEEETAIAEYESETKKNEIDRTTKEQDVKYKTKESKDLDKATAENTADRSVVESELDTVNELLAKLEKRCIAKAETYEERKRRREEELAGLKQALDVLENETAFVQKMKAHRTLRGAGKA